MGDVVSVGIGVDSGTGARNNPRTRTGERLGPVVVVGAFPEVGDGTVVHSGDGRFRRALPDTRSAVGGVRRLPKSAGRRIVIACVAAAALLLGANDARPASRLIYYGWGAPETSSVRTRCAEMEQSPLDGTSFVVALDRNAWRDGRTDTSNQLGWNLFGPRPLDIRRLRAAADDLQVCHWLRLTENFLSASVSSAGQDQGFSWGDDGRWATIVENWRTFARIARSAGCRGVILDPEHYGAQFFSSKAMLAREHGSDADLRVVVERRGRALMEALADGHPYAVVLALYGHTLVTTGNEEVRQEYDLYPAFLDGMLTAAPDTIQLVDGFEFAYGFRVREEFAAAYREIQAAAAVSRVPDRYRSRVRAGFGLWLDHGGARKWSTDDPSRNFFTPDGFGQALREALRASDGYVWIYSQRPRFFPPHDLPKAYLDAIRAAREVAGDSKSNKVAVSSEHRLPER